MDHQELSQQLERRGWVREKGYLTAPSAQVRVRVDAMFITIETHNAVDEWEHNYGCTRALWKGACLRALGLEHVHTPDLSASA